MTLDLSNKTILFVHIYKTAGSSFRSILTNNFGKNHITVNFTNEPVYEFTKEEFERIHKLNPKFQALSTNHIDISDLDRNNFVIVSFIRDPFRQVVSHFKQLIKLDIEKNNKDHFKSFAKRHLNAQTNILLGNKKVYSQTFERVFNSYTFIGLTEEFDESLVVFKKKILNCPEFDVRYKKQNVSKVELAFDISDSEKKEIYELNKLDYQLYLQVKKTLENCKREIGDEFIRDVEKFKIENTNYKPPYLKTNYNRFLRRLILNYQKFFYGRTK